MSADKDRGIRRQKQKRVKDAKRAARRPADKPAAAAQAGERKAKVAQQPA